MERDASEAVPAGSIIAGKYLIAGSLGAGGMAQVYESVHVGLDTPVAVTVLDARYAQQNEFIERFNRERRRPRPSRVHTSPRCSTSAHSPTAGHFWRWSFSLVTMSILAELAK